MPAPGAQSYCPPVMSALHGGHEVDTLMGWESVIMFLQAEKFINFWLQPLVAQGNGSSSLYYPFQR